ncbi:MAG: hypothetical protein ACLQIB_41840 [Isosphaeraceae bacterium]
MQMSPRVFAALCAGFLLPAFWAARGPSQTTQTDRRQPDAAGTDRNDAAARPQADDAESSLRMSRAVVCRSIDGYEAYEPLPDAAQTSDEKLLVYYRPEGYKSVVVDGLYQAHFTQDAQIRKRGEKAVMRQKLKLLEYKARNASPPQYIYLRNTISLKGLPPGDYDLTIILRDEVAKCPAATQVVKFRVIPAQDPRKAKST